MDEFGEKLGKGYGKNQIILNIIDFCNIFAYWEIGKKEQEEIKNMPKCKEGGLVLRILDSRNLPVKTIKIGDDNFLGSYYLKREHGIKPNTKYFAEIGFFNGGFYSKLTEKSNTVETPRDEMSDDTSEEWLDTGRKKEAVLESRFDKKSTLKLIEKTDKQIKEDRKSSEFFHNYFIK